MNIADQLLALNDVKQGIKQAINDKGISTAGIPFSQYHTLISDLGEGYPIGAILPNTTGTVPSDRLECDGTEHLIPGYPVLADVLRGDLFSPIDHVTVEPTLPSDFAGVVGAVSPTTRPSYGRFLVGYLTGTNTMFVKRPDDGGSYESMFSTPPNSGSDQLTAVHADTTYIYFGTTNATYGSLLVYDVTGVVMTAGIWPALPAVPTTITSDSLYVYIGMPNRFMVIDKTSKAVLLNHTHNLGATKGIYPSAGRVLITTELSPYLIVVNISGWTLDPTSAVSITSIIGNQFAAVARGGRIWLAGNNGLKIINENTLAYEQTINAYAGTSITSSGDYVYAMQQIAAGKYSINVYHNVNGELVGKYFTDNTKPIVADDSYLYSVDSTLPKYRQWSLSHLNSNIQISLALSKRIDQTDGDVTATVADNKYIYIAKHKTSGVEACILSIVKRSDYSIVDISTAIMTDKLIVGMAQDDSYVYIQTRTSFYRMNKFTLIIEASGATNYCTYSPATDRIHVDDQYIYVLQNGVDAPSGIMVYDKVTLAIATYNDVPIHFFLSIAKFITGLSDALSLRSIGTTSTHVVMIYQGQFKAISKSTWLVTHTVTARYGTYRYLSVSGNEAIYLATTDATFPLDFLWQSDFTRRTFQAGTDLCDKLLSQIGLPQLTSNIVMVKGVDDPYRSGVYCFDSNGKYGFIQLNTWRAKKITGGYVGSFSSAYCDKDCVVVISDTDVTLNYREFIESGIVRQQIRPSSAVNHILAANEDYIIYNNSSRAAGAVDIVLRHTSEYQGDIKSPGKYSDAIPYGISKGMFDKDSIYLLTTTGLLYITNLRDMLYGPTFVINPNITTRTNLETITAFHVDDDFLYISTNTGTGNKLYVLDKTWNANIIKVYTLNSTSGAITIKSAQRTFMSITPTSVGHVIAIYDKVTLNETYRTNMIGTDEYTVAPASLDIMVAMSDSYVVIGDSNYLDRLFILDIRTRTWVQNQLWDAARIQLEVDGTMVIHNVEMMPNKPFVYIAYKTLITSVWHHRLLKFSLEDGSYLMEDANGTWTTGGYRALVPGVTSMLLFPLTYDHAGIREIRVNKKRSPNHFYVPDIPAELNSGITARPQIKSN